MTTVVTSADSRATTNRRVLAVAVAVGILVVGLVMDSLGIVNGPFAIVLGLALLAAFPSARQLSRRLAINGSVYLGLTPILWWAPWPEEDAPTRTGLILSLASAILVAVLVNDARRVRSVVPRVSTNDISLVGAVAVLAWLFRPFYLNPFGIEAVSLLRQAFGGDNVAHFNMFRMIRSTGATGPQWPLPEDGTLFAYVFYPQHFHTLVAQTAELWAGPGLLTVDGEVGLFLVGSAGVVSLSVVVLVAALCSLEPLQNRPWLALVVTSAVLSFVVFGFGAYALSFGFPPYLLAIAMTLVTATFALRPGRPTANQIVAMVAATIVVAHSWSLLAPLAGFAVMWSLVRLPWANQRIRRHLIALSATAIILVAAAGGWALYLVANATSTAGGFVEALATPGGTPQVSLSLTVALGMSLVGIGLLSRREGANTRSIRFAGALAGLAGLQAFVLLFIQLSRSGALSYFQIKFINALFIVFAVLLVVVVVLLIATRASRPRGPRSQAIAGVRASVAALVIIVLSGLPIPVTDSLASSTLPGILFRSNAQTQAQTPLELTERLIAAAGVMAGQPCGRPIYLAVSKGDDRFEEMNQWAMSLSSTWTEAAGPINTYLLAQNEEDNTRAPATVIARVLAEFPETCIIVAPGVLESVENSFDPVERDRLFAW